MHPIIDGTSSFQSMSVVITLVPALKASSTFCHWAFGLVVKTGGARGQGFNHKFIIKMWRSLLVMIEGVYTHVESLSPFSQIRLNQVIGLLSLRQKKRPIFPQLAAMLKALAVLLTFNKRQAIYNLSYIIKVKVEIKNSNLNKFKGTKTTNLTKACFSLCIPHYGNEMEYIRFCYHSIEAENLIKMCKRTCSSTYHPKINIR